MQVCMEIVVGAVAETGIVCLGGGGEEGVYHETR